MPDRRREAQPLQLPIGRGAHPAYGGGGRVQQRRESTVEQGRCGCTQRERRPDIGIAPGRRTVPHILHARVVVGEGADDEIAARRDEAVGIAKFRVVRTQMAHPVAVVLLVVIVRVGRLREQAEVVGNLARQENAADSADHIVQFIGPLIRS